MRNYLAPATFLVLPVPVHGFINAYWVTDIVNSTAWRLTCVILLVTVYVTPALVDIIVHDSTLLVCFWILYFLVLFTILEL